MWNCANAAQKLSYDIYITVSYHFFAPIARQNCFFVGVFFTTPLRAGISCQICAPSPAKSRSRSAYPRRTNSTPPRRLLPRAASAASASAAPPRRSGAVSFAPRSVPPGCTYNVRSATRTFAPSAAKPSAQAKRCSNTLSCKLLSPCAQSITAASSGQQNLSVSAGRWNITRLATPITNKINKGLSHDDIYSASFVNRLPCCQP